MLHSSTLGASLYVPATRADLAAIADGTKHPDLRSVVFDLEDSVLESDTGFAIANLAALFRLRASGMRAVETRRPLLFVRPRNAAMLAQILALPGAGTLDGFVVPKVTAALLPEYLCQLQFSNQYIMPTIETREAFDHVEMIRLREQLLTIKEKVLAIRIGGNDLLQTMGCRRSPVRTAYEGPLGSIIATLVTTFVPWGFQMSAPVLENFSDMALLQAEIDLDIEHALWTKTAIHPDQVEMIHHAYRVEVSDYENALAIVASNAPAVFASNGVMSEPATHRGWAEATIARARDFGLRPGGVALSLVG